MRTIKLFFALLLVSLTFNFADAATPAFPEEVAVRDAINPIQPKRARSLLPTCSGLITNNYFTLYVNEYIGVATVVAENTTTGDTFSATIDSDSECEVAIAEQLTEGVYTLTVSGIDGYLGEGNFKIE